MLLEHRTRDMPQATVASVRDIGPKPGEILRCLQPGTLAQEQFHFLTTRPGRVPRESGWLGQTNAFLPTIGDAIESGLHPSPSDGEIHGPVPGVDQDVRERKRGRTGKFLEASAIGRSLLTEVHGIELSVRPVAGKEGLLVLSRELRSIAETHAGG